MGQAEQKAKKKHWMTKCLFEVRPSLLWDFEKENNDKQTTF